jgi:hypothetical protein
MRKEGIWPEKPTQTIIGPSSNSAFGSELVLQQSSLAVSSYDGTVNLYKRTDEGWAEENIRLNPPLQDDAFFGRSLCLSDNILVVGTMHYEKLRGTVYIYEHGKDDWHLSPSKTLVSPDQTSSFGHVVSCDSRSIVIGEPNGKNSRGSIYIYEY